MQQQANVTRCNAPILTFAPLSCFILDSPAKPLKCVGKTERIIPQIFIDLFFNQDMAMRTPRFRQNAESGQAVG
jgi:hypothetical protein